MSALYESALEALIEEHQKQVILSPWPHKQEWRLVKIPAILLFKTRLVRRHPWIRKIAKAVGEVFVLEGINGEVIDWPAGHFGTYFRCTPRRKYENPYIEDLYWLHEIYHLYTWLPGARQMTPRERESWYDWQRRMVHSEIRAACASECMAHIFIPGLREKTFQHPIWVDRFLARTDWMEAVRQGTISRNQAFKEVKRARRRCLEHPRYDDYVEAQVHAYYQSNLDWVKLWGLEPAAGLSSQQPPTNPAFRAVEEHLQRLNAGTVTDTDHAQWLLTMCQNPADVVDAYRGVPFPTPAGSFADRFRAYYRDFGNAVFLA